MKKNNINRPLNYISDDAFIDSGSRGNTSFGRNTCSSRKLLDIE